MIIINHVDSHIHEPISVSSQSLSLMIYNPLFVVVASFLLINPIPRDGTKA
jgi:hypothetical protein